MIIKVATGGMQMSIKGILILILPIVLHIKGDIALLVFLIMNSIINLLMEYTKIQMGILGSIADNAELIESNIEKGKGYDESFEEYMNNVNHEELDKWIPKPIKVVGSISMIISIAAIIFGIVNLIKGLV